MFSDLQIKVSEAELISAPTTSALIIDKPCQLLVYLDTHHCITTH